VIFITVEATTANKEDTVLLYGHLDKQPPLTEFWESGLGPHTPVIRDGKLYGRGGADDGYALFGAITAIKALKEQDIPHSRCVILIEACEESGSRDLPFYISHLKERIGLPSLIICLDSGCGNYDQLWLTSSLRGCIVGNIKVDVLREGVHSGHASGVVPSSFRIARQVLSRLEDEHTGIIKPQEFFVEIPQERVEQAKLAAQVLGEIIRTEYPWHQSTSPVTDDLTELLLNKTWRPALEVVGADGLPSLEAAGNVLRKHTTLKVSLRIPPTADPRKLSQALKTLFEKDPPYNATVTFEGEKASVGWDAPPTAPWLAESMDKASRTYFNKPACYFGEGGSIPFMGMLGAMFPKAQFMITGLLGPKSNAHGPNEFLHIGMGKGVTACVASVLAEQPLHSTQ